MDSDRKNRNGSMESGPSGVSLSSGAAEGDGVPAEAISGRAVKLDRATQTRIGDQLRAMYGELLEQPVPERFRALLGQLDGAAAEKRATGAGDDREASR